MIDGVPIALLTQGGAWGMVAFGVYAIMRGKLIPRSWVESVVATERTRGDDWRAIASTLVATTTEHGKQLDLLLEGSRTTNTILEGIRQASTGRGGR